MTPDPYPLPFKDPYSIRHSHGQPIPKGHVCAIEYHRDDSGRLHPHSVWTAEEATLAQRRRHVGGMRRRFYFATWDFQPSKADSVTYYHNSGNGAPYMHPLCSARRFKNKYPEMREKRHNSAAIWFNPRICYIRKGWFSGTMNNRVPVRSLASYGYTLLKRPARLGRDGNRDPFTDAAGYAVTEGGVEYCSICQDWLGTESLYDGSSPCTHIWECYRDECGMTGPGLEDAVCTCKTRAECREKCGGDDEPEDDDYLVNGDMRSDGTIVNDHP